jgi:hypothetical protein
MLFGNRILKSIFECKGENATGNGDNCLMRSVVISLLANIITKIK